MSRSLFAIVFCAQLATNSAAKVDDTTINDSIQFKLSAARQQEVL